MSQIPVGVLSKSRFSILHYKTAIPLDINDFFSLLGSLLFIGQKFVEIWGFKAKLWVFHLTLFHYTDYQSYQCRSWIPNLERRRFHFCGWIRTCSFLFAGIFQGLHSTLLFHMTHSRLTASLCKNYSSVFLSGEMSSWSPVALVTVYRQVLKAQETWCYIFLLIQILEQKFGIILKIKQQ